MRCHLTILAAAMLAISPAQTFKTEKFRLPNGMTVILSEDHSLPIVSTNIWYRVGSKDEPERRSGFAHLFEHLMFMGTKRVPNGVFDTTMEEFGGANNASTWNDKTNYYDWGPSSLLPVLLWLEADRLESLADDMTLEKLNLQREVVKNERREGVDNAPYGQAYETIDSLIFPKAHPYHTSVIGSMEDLNAATVQDVQDFFRTYYVPNNASLVVAGDFDPKATKALIRKLFGSLPRKNDIVRKPVPPASISGVKRVTMVDKVSDSKVLMVWHSPKAFSLSDFSFRLGSGILGDGPGSRLYEALVVQKELATDVSVSQDSRLLGSVFSVDATAREGVSLPTLEKAIDVELAKFLKDGPTKAELDRQKAKYRIALTNSMQQLENRADKLNEYEFYYGTPDGFSKELGTVQGLTPLAVKSHFKMIDLGKRLILRVIPEMDGPEQNPRDEKPAMSPAKSFDFPKPAGFSLPNGNAGFYWQKRSVPITTLTLRLGIGAADDPLAKAGMSNLMVDMLQQGAGGKSSEQFANALDALGASFSTFADARGISLTLTAPSSTIAPAVALMKDAVLTPNMRQADFNRVKALRLQDLAAADDNPSALASKVANRAFFGPDHPYGISVLGTEETVSKLTLADIKACYRSRVLVGLATWYAAGDKPVTVVKKLLADAFGSWSARGQAPAPRGIAMPVAQPARLLIVDRPGAVQTAITVRTPLPPFSSPDRPAIEELGIVLGGSFTSRLNQDLREQKGYTYGIGFGTVFSKDVTYASLSTAVRGDVTGASLKAILDQVSSIRSGNVTDSEAAKARALFQYGAVTDAETLQGLVSAGIGYRENGIAFAGVAAELARYNKLTPADLNRIAREAVAWERAIIVLVGDKSEILKQIEGLGLPQPEIVQ